MCLILVNDSYCMSGNYIVFMHMFKSCHNFTFFLCPRCVLVVCKWGYLVFKSLDKEINNSRW